ncbi:MAG: DUF4440 domain-containing protein [Woeseiaceae bacterium]|nr:DUF4440 domain-containing protein [Woeseiaceae bacterium]NIP21388.1 DUF4440 domain-containing protein [Woeseiaceae bacterium]
MKTYFQACLCVVTLMTAPVAVAADVDDVTAMLHEFLANADKRAAHEKFWAEDLVYTSSSGLRFGKAEIMQGFEGAEESDEPPAVIYSGEEVDVRLYGDMAVVAFKLIGTASNRSATLYYYNTGTFLKRDGIWKVVAWQATRIPPAGD